MLFLATHKLKEKYTVLTYDEMKPGVSSFILGFILRHINEEKFHLDFRLYCQLLILHINSHVRHF